jgi:uncharacterized protein DUF6404
MTHRQKVDRLIADLGKRGVGAFTVAPPLFRLLWSLGLEVPPPLFLGFVTLTLLMGGFFGVVWGVFMWLLQWQSGRVPVETAVLNAVGAGLLFGLSMAAYYRWKAVRLGLPSWESYAGV